MQKNFIFDLRFEPLHSICLFLKLSCFDMNTAQNSNTM